MSVIVNLKQTLDKHRTLLQEHVAIWQSIHRELGQDNSTLVLAAKCLQNTNAMLLACADAESIIEGATVRSTTSNGSRKHGPEEPGDQRTSKKAKMARATESMTPTVNDPSGLFMIDSNPSKVDDLLRSHGHEAPKSKRRTPEEAPLYVGSPPTIPQQDDSQKAKRKKSKATESDHIQASPNEIDKLHEAFEAKVELRLKEKHQAREKKVTRKRKRDSDTSVATNDDLITEETSANAQIFSTNDKKKKKKAKGAPPNISLPLTTDAGEDKSKGNTVSGPDVSKRAKKRLKKMI